MPFRLGFRTHMQGRGDQVEALRRFRSFHGYPDESFYGYPDEVIEALSREKVLPIATNLIARFNPVVPDYNAAIRALELITTGVALALGWRPSSGSDAAPAGTRAPGRQARPGSTR